ncbi:MAG TPA: hypothetical protein VE981_14480 [Planctomycetota bacterium]|nr:hypothetical protein [Planctomycetota bacterium]
MRLIPTSVLLCSLALGCRPGSDRLEVDPAFNPTPGTIVAVLPVFDRFGGFDAELLRKELVDGLTEWGYRGVLVNPADQPSGEWTPARAALAAREAGAQAALAVSLLPSDRPIHPRAPEDAFGRQIAPAPPPGRWFWGRTVYIGVAEVRPLVVADTELREPGMKPFFLARILLRPLER